WVAVSRISRYPSSQYSRLSLAIASPANWSFFPQIRNAGTFAREASGSNANFDGRNRAARYQLSIAVSAPFLAHDSLYCSRSELEKTPGGEVFRSTRPSTAHSRLRRMTSGNQGN